MHTKPNKDDCAPQRAVEQAVARQYLGDNATNTRYLGAIYTADEIAFKQKQMEEDIQDAIQKRATAAATISAARIKMDQAKDLAKRGEAQSTAAEEKLARCIQIQAEAALNASRQAKLAEDAAHVAATRTRNAQALQRASQTDASLQAAGTEFGRASDWRDPNHIRDEIGGLNFDSESGIVDVVPERCQHQRLLWYEHEDVASPPAAQEMHEADRAAALADEAKLSAREAADLSTKFCWQTDQAAAVVEKEKIQTDQAKAAAIQVHYEQQEQALAALDLMVETDDRIVAIEALYARLSATSPAKGSDREIYKATGGTHILPQEVSDRFDSYPSSTTAPAL